MKSTKTFVPCWKCRRCDKPIHDPKANESGFCSLCQHVLNVRERQYDNQIKKLKNA